MNEIRRSIILTGYMGCGKTTVGRELSLRTGKVLADTDEMIVERENCPVPQIFAEKGEPYFRDLETKLLRDLDAGETDMVCSTGGGIVLRRENRELLKKIGFTVWLTASPETISERLASDRERPLLPAGADPERIRVMIKERTEAYKESADLIVRTDGKKPEEIADIVIPEGLENTVPEIDFDAIFDVNRIK